MTQKLQQLQQAIREVCPDLYNNDYLESYEDAHLEHILRAIFTNGDIEDSVFTQIDWVKQNMQFIEVIHDADTTVMYDYNLTLPLDQQAPEVIDFLHSIICKG